jgi:transposase
MKLTTADVVLLKYLLFEQQLPREAIAARFGVNERTVRRWQNKYQLFGSPFTPRSVVQGRPRLLTDAEVDDLVLYADDHPTASQYEMAYYLFDRHGVNVSIPTVSRALAGAGWSFKIAKKRAEQRNETLRSHWRAKRLFWYQEQIVFIDESASSPRTGDRKRGWSPIGIPCLDTQRLRREVRWSVLPALTVNGYLQDPLIIQGGVTMLLFEDWFESKLLPQLRLGMIVVMDNASCHRSEFVRQLCLAQGIQLEFLPPYSPDLNPIEESFNVLKAWVRGNISMAPIFSNFGAFIAHAVKEVGAQDARGWFEHCGYE